MPLPAAKPLNLGFLDGIRALMSISVVLYHAHRVQGLLLPAAATARLLQESRLFR